MKTPFGAQLEHSNASTNGLSGAIKDWIEHQCEVVYRYRNAIENGFRLDSLVMPKTGAHTASLRFFMYGLGLVIFNIYMFYYLIRTRLGYHRLASVKIFVYFLAYHYANIIFIESKNKAYKSLCPSKSNYWRPPPIT